MIKEEILQYLESKMSVDEVSGSLTITRVSGTLDTPVARTIADIKEYFSHTDYTPLFDSDGKHHTVSFGIFKKTEDKPKYWLNVLLFLVTIVTTMFAGSFNSGGNPLANLHDIWLGIPFSFSLMAILTCHEFGHYIVSKRAGMITSLPYFIPAPHFLGTFGAVIRMKSIIPSRRSLLRVGMAGPLAGFIVAIPITVIGISLSTVQPAAEGETFLRLGDSLLFSFLAEIFHPDIPNGHDLFLHPMAFAGWIGFLITSMNLLPLGQLDGGHVSYSVFLRKRRMSYIPIFAILIGLGIFFWFGWIIWGLLALFFARRDPVIQDAITPLTTREKVYACLPFLVLVLTFIPQPFAIG
jgi:membrane-associated protease RseP (regulator of RpoE activity)